jgi:hypothetical protein
LQPSSARYCRLRSAGDDERGDHDGIKNGEVAEPGEVCCDGEVEGNKDQEVATGDLGPICVITEEERDPGKDDNDGDGSEDPDKI